ncbi:hypothetical protein [Draconibacterium sediminis]|uniref:Uncharacterized protein n=1 Tax=Draconibacterium sediminis TaxID=1544798 RepID=A0A0D8J989_9BACT|nr:hypothetical protein [Draconibacterium sediminis]KJF43467.1 hypothetical protein LH29_14690 [Draconibacterium sediminis]
MNYSIFINQIIAPVKFANELIEFLLTRHGEFEISIYGKIDASDRKFLKGIIKNPFLGTLIFKRYDLLIDSKKYETIKSRIEKYFENDWGLKIDENHKGLFSTKNKVLGIDCIDEKDKHEKAKLFNKLINKDVIDKFEIIEDDYVDPYFENEENLNVAMKNLTINEFVSNYNKKDGLKKGGSLCFYGHWFGRPYDNFHQIESLSFDSSTNKLSLTFDEKETLIIVNPKEISESEKILTIKSADKIIWNWFSYGKSQTSENLYFIEINKDRDELIGKSNVDWYKPDFNDLSIEEPALAWI